MNQLNIEKDRMALHRAAVAGNLPEVERLLRSEDARDLAHALNENLEYPLYSALALPAVQTSTLKADKEAIFIQLLNFSSDVLAHQNRDGDTVLHRITQHGFLSLLERILPHHQASDLLLIRNKDGVFPIHTAVLNGQLGIVTCLFEQLDSRDVFKLKDHAGNVPLHLAAAYGSLDMVKACFDGYPDGINFVNEASKTALDLAEKNNFPGVQGYLREHGGTHGPAASLGDTYIAGQHHFGMS